MHTIRRRTINAVAAAFMMAALTAFVLAGNTFAQSGGIPRDYVAVVLSVNGDILTVQADFGVADVLPDASTRVVLPLDAKASISDLLPGDEVAVSLKDGSAVVAEKILLIPGKSKYRHVTGQVLDLTGTSVTIQGPGAATEPVVLKITPFTRTINRSYPSKLATGSYVVVVVERDPNTGTTGSEAIEINLVPPPSQQSQTSPAVPPTPEPQASAATATLFGVFEGVDATGKFVVRGT